MIRNTMPRLVAALLFAATTALVAACTRDSANHQSTGAALPVATQTTAHDANLTVVNNNGRLHYNGTVDSETTRNALLTMFDEAFGAELVSGQIAIDPHARAPEWLGRLAPMLSAFTTSGAVLTLKGDRIELSGSVSAAERSRLLLQAQSQFPDAEYAGLFEHAGGGSGVLNPAAIALAELDPDAGPDALVDALNLMTVEFEPGSARVSSASLDLISRAAQAIAAAPDTTRIEIGGHASSSGNADDDLFLSKQRAEAVKVQLIVNGVSPARVETRGYGQTRAANAGRDRVAFSVLPASGSG